MYDLWECMAHQVKINLSPMNVFRVTCAFAVIIAGRSGWCMPASTMSMKEPCIAFQWDCWFWYCRRLEACGLRFAYAAGIEIMCCRCFPVFEGLMFPILQTVIVL